METRGRKPKGESKRDKYLRVRLSAHELAMIKKTVSDYNAQWQKTLSEADMVVGSVDFVRRCCKIGRPDEPLPDQEGAYDPLAVTTL